MVKSDPIAVWAFHNEGIRTGRWNANGTEWYTECIFCQNADGLYINPAKNVFKCQACEKAGNYLTFLEQIAKINEEAITDLQLQALADNRDLPIDAFRGYGIGWSGRYWTLPVRNDEGKFVGLKRYRTGEHLLQSPNTKVCLFGAEQLPNHTNPDGPIYLAEGEWDAIAMRWLLKETKNKGIVVAVPGAAISISPWVNYFYDKDVVCLYDHDKAGIDGEFKTYQLLETAARTLAFIRWPDVKPAGYDTRDHIVKFRLNPEKAYNLIHSRLHDFPRHLSNVAVVQNGIETKERRAEKLEPITYFELLEKYQDYLFLQNTDPIKVTLATILANRLRSDMLWLFLVADPSKGKSEIIMSLSGTPEIEMVDSLSEHTLVSGFLGPGGSDPSLLPKLRNRILAVKDFTPMLKGNVVKQETVFGTLRAAYDGDYDSKYGHSQNRTYKDLRFGIIAGVTNAIEAFGQLHQQLGERFIRYYLPSLGLEDKILDRALDNLSQEKAKRENVRFAVRRFLETTKNDLTMPDLSKVREQIKAVAKVTARMRGVVPRDFKDRIQHHPSQEGPVRVAKQFSLMALGLAKVERKDTVGDEELRIIRKMAVDTTPDLVRTVVTTVNAGNTYMSSANIEETTGFPRGTLKQVLENMVMLGMLKRVGDQFKLLYRLNDDFKQVLELSEMMLKPKEKFFVSSSQPHDGVQKTSHFPKRLKLFRSKKTVVH